MSLAEFPTNSLEMNAVANIFDMNNDGFIDYYEFVSALHPSRDPYRKTLDADQINEEVCRRNAENAWLSALRFTFFFFKVSRQVSQCNCPKRFQVEQISANRYRVSLFSPHRYWVVRITHSKNWCMITRLLLIPIMFFFFVCCSLEIPSSWGWFVFFEAHWWSE